MIRTVNKRNLEVVVGAKHCSLLALYRTHDSDIGLFINTLKNYYENRHMCPAMTACALTIYLLIILTLQHRAHYSLQSTFRI